MKKFTPIIYSLLILSTVIVSCKSEHAKNKTVAIPLHNRFFAAEADTDAKALSDAYNKSLYEKTLAGNVKNKSTNKETRALAATMILGHEVINIEIKTLADKKSISLPKELTREQQNEIAGIKDKNQEQLTKEYTVNLVNEHNNTIRIYQELAAVCKDPDIKEWFQNSLRLLNNNLDVANLYKIKLEGKQ
jgi:putative membrane protein